MIIYLASTLSPVLFFPFFQVRRLCGWVVSFYSNCIHLTTQRECEHVCECVCVWIAAVVCCLFAYLRWVKSVWASVGVFVFVATNGEHRWWKAGLPCRWTSNLFRHGRSRLMQHTCYPCTIISRCRTAKRSNINREITERESGRNTGRMRKKRRERACVRVRER